MKLILLVAMLAGLFIPLRGQQQWCLSTSCPDTPATSFGLDRVDKQLNKIFQTLPTLPDSKPVAPLALSPSTRQFFRYSVPTDAGYSSGLAGFRNAPVLVGTIHGSTFGTHAPAILNGSHIAGPTGQGGLVFNSVSPKF